MKLPLSWIREALGSEYTASNEEIAEQLTSLGLEVDALDAMELGFSGVVVGKVLSTKPHPDAEKLTVATVSDGKEEFQVVCGASNCRAGILTAFAKVGARLSTEDGKQFKIKKGKLRGVESLGMLCAAEELDLADSSSGIMELDASFEPGQDLADLCGEDIIEISLTPNLGHCFSLLGVVRELAALNQLTYSLPEPQIKEAADSIENRSSLDVQDKQLCPRYACRVIRGVKVGPSPAWLKSRVESCGMRSINNIVDATNLVMMERGHPLHAFDLGKLSGGIVVRPAQEGERFVTLDEQERTLKAGMLLICDKKQAVAIAGVMGGLNSEVSESTTDLLLESAYFDATSVRRTSKALGLGTEASRRFERGTDLENVIPALERAAALIAELSGGEVLAGRLDSRPEPAPLKEIRCRVARINALLGLNLSQSEVEDFLTRLEFKCIELEPGVINVTVPSYRNDVSLEEDVAEDVGRIYGYDRFPRDLARYTSCPLPHSRDYLFERELRHILIGQGLQELMTCDLIGPSLMGLVKEQQLTGRHLIKVTNPTSVEQSILRPTLLPGLLEVVKHNVDHQHPNLAAFEVGKVHFKSDDGDFLEQPTVAIVMTGQATEGHWSREAPDFDFFDLKGRLEALFEALGIPESAIDFERSKHANFHPGRQADIFLDQLDIGVIGEIHPATQGQLDVPQRIFFAELELAPLYTRRITNPQMEELANFPGSERDWTLTLSKDLSAAALLAAVDKVPSKLLNRRQIISVYESADLGQDRHNVTLNFLYRHANKTLAQEAVDREHDRVVQGVLAELGDSVLSL